MLAPMLRFSVVSVLAVLALAAPAAAATPASPTPPTARALRTATVNGATLGYRDLNPSAAGRALVMIAGYGVTMAEWDPLLVEALADGHRVIVFDNRGVGTSTGSVRGLTIAKMADDTAALIARLRLGAPDVLGWSMGGYIAQELALRHPSSVHRLVLASANPGSPKSTQPSQRVIDVLTSPSTTATGLLPVLFPSDQQAAGKAWLASISGQPGLTAADFATPAATMAAQEAATAGRWYGTGKGTYARLGRLRQPTLVAYGADDVIVPPANAKLLGARLPHATLRRYADAGHAFLFQEPTAKGRAFAAFLRGPR
jgi:pimeloyl-ACP methyl ester carboxylesterase